MDTITVDNTPDTEPTPTPSRIGLLKAERNRWFAVCLTLVVGMTLSIGFAWQAYQHSMNNFEILYVKLQPNGAWDVVNYHGQDDQLYFKTTIDSLLAGYVRDRYGLEPQTVANDWGRAETFMSDDLVTHFESPAGFDAINKAASVAANPHHKVNITWRFNDHYDAFNTTSSDVVVRTNIYFTMTAVDNGIDAPPVNMTLLVKWTLLSKENLEQRSKDYIVINPLNLKILSESLTEEPTGATS